MPFINNLIALFDNNANPEYAPQMKAYLRNNFELYGIKTKLRRELLKEVVSNHKDEVNLNIRSISNELFTSNYRELQHCGVELFEKLLRKKYKKDDIEQIEFFITTNSWWDTVDFIAKQILGAIAATFTVASPET